MNFFRIMVLALLIGSFLFSGLCFYQKKTPSIVHIAAIDEAKIRTTSKPFLLIKSFVENYHRTLQQDLSQKETELRHEYETIQQSLEVRSKIEQKKQEFHQKIANLHKDLQKRQDSLNQHLSTLTKNIEDVLARIIKHISSSKNICIVLNMNLSDRFSWIDPSLDITDEVISRLSQELPQIDLPVLPKNSTHLP